MAACLTLVLNFLLFGSVYGTNVTEDFLKLSTGGKPRNYHEIVLT